MNFLFLCTCQAFPGPSSTSYVTVVTRLRYVYLSTLDGTARSCSRSPARRIVLAACSTIDRLQMMRLM